MISTVSGLIFFQRFIGYFLSLRSIPTATIPSPNRIMPSFGNSRGVFSAARLRSRPVCGRITAGTPADAVGGGGSVPAGAGLVGVRTGWLGSSVSPGEVGVGSRVVVAGGGTGTVSVGPSGVGDGVTNGVGWATGSVLVAVGVRSGPGGVWVGPGSVGVGLTSVTVGVGSRVAVAGGGMTGVSVGGGARNQVILYTWRVEPGVLPAVSSP